MKKSIFMRRYHLCFEAGNTSYLHQYSLQMRDLEEGSHFEMNEISTRESVTLQGKTWYLSTLQISHIPSIIRTTGGVMPGILWSMEKNGIAREVRWNRWESFSGRFRIFRYFLFLLKMLSITTTSDISKIVTILLHEESSRMCTTLTGWPIPRIHSIAIISSMEGNSMAACVQNILPCHSISLTVRIVIDQNICHGASDVPTA